MYRHLLVLFALTFSPLTVGATLPSHQELAAYETQFKVDAVLFLMQKRLAIMHEVARTKWTKKLAIDDKEREQQILASIASKAQEMGVNEEWARKFFQAQFDAAKMIQQSAFDMWTYSEQGPFESILDLKDDIRPYLDAVTHELLAALAKASPLIQSGVFADQIIPFPPYERSSDQFEEGAWQAATAPFSR